MPNRLLIKPRPLAINWSHDLARGLVWCTMPGIESRRDLVSGLYGIPLTSGSFAGKTILGSALGSSATTDGGAYWPWSIAIQSILRSFSIVVWARIDGLTAFSHLLTIPYSNAWNSPFYVLHFLENNTTDKIAVAWTVSAANTSVIGTIANTMVTGPLVMFSVTVSSTTTVFYKNGIFQESTATGTSGNIDMGNKREITLFNHNSAATGEGISGGCPYAAIWNRSLTQSDMARLYVNPFQFLKPSQIMQSSSAIFARTPPAAAATVNIGYRTLMGVGI